MSDEEKNPADNLLAAARMVNVVVPLLRETNEKPE